MVRLRSPNRRSPPDYLSRRGQWRLLLLVAALGLVIVAMGVVRGPESAAWLGLLLTGGESPQPATTSPAAPALPTIEGGPTVRIAAVDDSAAAPTYIPGVDPALLVAIRDETHFRAAEQLAWFNLLSVLQAMPPADLAAASLGEVGYAQLVGQPRAYRGRIVTVRGTVHQVTLQHPAKNDLGLESYYRLVIRPASGGLWPIFIYSLELPAGMQPGEDPSQPIVATGFFFKDLSYRWQDGLGIAPVVLAKNVVDASATSGDESVSPAPSPLPLPLGEGRVATGDSPWRGEGALDPSSVPAESAAVSASARTSLAEVLSLAGWDTARLAEFADDTPLADDQFQSLVELAWRLRQFDAASVAAWTLKDVSAESVAADPEKYRGQLIHVAGHIRRVARHELSIADARRLDLPAWYRCEMELDGGVPATVVAAQVPKVWLEMSELDQPAAASALFLKRLPEGEADGGLLLVCDEVAWYPTAALEPYVSFGEAVLGTLGMDVALLDEVRNRRPILDTERDAFYSILEAVGTAGASQLVRFAQQDLTAVRERWAAEAKRLTAEADATSREPADRDLRKQAQLADEVVRSADEGRYSVAPLFNDPDKQVGRLGVYDGVVRRAVRIEVGTAPDGSPSDVLRRYGIDHYYEVELFTDDSQGYPLVFCVRELPDGFPTGGAIQEPVRVAGFFFKSWLYQTRKPGPDPDGEASAGMSQFAPLLVGRSPIWLKPAASDSRWSELAMAGLFILAVACVWGLVWWYARGDRRFDRQVLAERYTLPEGQTLDDLNVPDNVPDEAANADDKDG